jgi:predicted nucleic acid-binding protein
VAEGYVIDTSALFAFAQDEPGADRVEEILKSASSGGCKAYISFITLAEIYYVTWQEEGESAAKELIGMVKSLPLTIVESSERQTLLAGRIKANCRVSLADAFIAATASCMSATLIHKDPEFEQTAPFISSESLSYKPKQKR